jgi:hypothetical protein
MLAWGFPQEGGSTTLSVTGKCLVEVDAVMDQTLNFRDPIRCSRLITFFGRNGTC